MDTILIYVVACAALMVSLFKDKRKTVMAIKKALKSLEGILPQFIVILLFVSVTLAVLNTELISRFMGSSSGFLGVMGAAIVGSATLIPGFVAFPAAAALLAGGAGVTQIAAFVSSLMMVGVVTLPLEIKYFGRRAAFTRNGLAFAFSLVAAVFVGWVVAL
ncbi:MAG: permease [Spirochaetia bacterium]|jgi:uncharacterized membrane protein YraQ (UPF0718 family)|nr:permease [Spirochaetia bacterium]